MRSVFSSLLAYVVSRFRSHQSLRLENMTLRHQLVVYQQTVTRPKLRPFDRLFWVWLSCLWPAWQQALTFVQPRTVTHPQHGTLALPAGQAFRAIRPRQPRHLRPPTLPTPR